MRHSTPSCMLTGLRLCVFLSAGLGCSGEQTPADPTEPTEIPTTPTLTLSPVAAVTPQATTTISGTASDDRAVVLLTIAATVGCCQHSVDTLSITPAAQVTFSETYSLPEGATTFTVSAYNGAGRKAEATLHLMVDLTAPQPTYVMAPVLASADSIQVSLAAWDNLSDTLHMTYAVGDGPQRPAGVIAGQPSPYPLYPKPYFHAGSIRVPFAAATANVLFGLIDAAGNRTEVARRSIRTAPVTAVVAGANHWCALTADGSVWCGGENEHGQIGNGSTVPSAAPGQITGGLSFVRIAAGFRTTCGITISGELYCWGALQWNETYGIVPTEIATSPTLISADMPFRHVATGQGQTCALADDGTAYCWGLNAAGQLGDGTTTYRLTPTPVSGDLKFSMIAAGQQHTCGITLDAKPYCWGDNYAGQLGDGSTVGSMVPRAVSTPLEFEDLVAGAWQTCGIAVGGTAYCWGSSENARLGGRLIRVAVTIPEPVLIGEPVRSISVLTDRGCAAAVSGNAYCWGGSHFPATEYNPLGTLFANPLQMEPYPFPTAYGLALSTVHTTSYGTCALSRDQALYCWGGRDHTYSTPLVDQ